VDHVVIKKTIIGRSSEMRILVSAMDLTGSVMSEEDMVVVVVLISIISVADVMHTSVV
jgi:hypothetical protein